MIVLLRSRPLAVLSAAALALSCFGALALTTTAPAAPASDLMFSVYIEGSGNNKAIELYNPTTAAVDMSSYKISLYVNGNTTTQATLFPDATIAPGGYYVITNSQATETDLIAKSDRTSGVASFNGNDVLTLTKDSVVVDSIGQLGTDPGTEWGGRRYLHPQHDLDEERLHGRHRPERCLRPIGRLRGKRPGRLLDARDAGLRGCGADGSPHH